MVSPLSGSYRVCEVLDHQGRLTKRGIGGRYPHYTRTTSPGRDNHMTRTTTIGQ
ncbi:hypothetical protein J6590_089931, partial [Homalodisca vitripennis]